MSNDVKKKFEEASIDDLTVLLGKLQTEANEVGARIQYLKEKGEKSKLRCYVCDQTICPGGVI
jgi:hypothetical protein